MSRDVRGGLGSGRRCPASSPTRRRLLPTARLRARRSCRPGDRRLPRRHVPLAGRRRHPHRRCCVDRRPGGRRPSCSATRAWSTSPTGAPIRDSAPARRRCCRHCPRRCSRRQKVSASYWTLSIANVADTGGAGATGGSFTLGAGQRDVDLVRDVLATGERIASSPTATWPPCCSSPAAIAVAASDRWRLDRPRRRRSGDARWRA